MEQLNIRILRASYEAFTSATPQAARSLIRGLLTVEVGSRFPSKQALNHQWFGGTGSLPAAQCGAITERAAPPATAVHAAPSPAAAMAAAPSLVPPRSPQPLL